MTEPKQDEDPFVREVRRQAERARAGRRLTFWRGLGQISMVGWMVSMPGVLGALLGGYLDDRFDTGLFWSLALILVGLVMGCAAAWRHAKQELSE
jgi:ATP synthase protein I